MNNREALCWAVAALVLCVVVVLMFSWMGWYTGKWEHEKNEHNIPYMVYDYKYHSMNYKVFRNINDSRTIFIINVTKDSLECLYLEEKSNQLIWNK